MTKRVSPPKPKQRKPILDAVRNTKMASSAHAYMRGSTLKFYQWLESSSAVNLPQGPSIWICGDCHVGNLGPIADAKGNIEIQIRDLDQTVIGNPAHDLMRLGLSLATAARGSDLPGIITVKMLEQLIEGYESAFADDANDIEPASLPASIKLVMKESAKRSWKQLAVERLELARKENAKPAIPIGKRFWPLASDEKKAIKQLFEVRALSRLATRIKHREDEADVKVTDAAYWMKGCSSLGLLRYAVLLDVADIDNAHGKDMCLIDIKEAIKADAPRDKQAQMPTENAERVLEGARHLSPHLGERMAAARLLGRSVFIRELLPQDLKLELDQLTPDEAMRVAYFLAQVVGRAHARQMDSATRLGWLNELKRNRTKHLNAPSWLWSGIVELLTIHEASYLEHCRKYADTLQATVTV